MFYFLSRKTHERSICHLFNLDKMDVKTLDYFLAAHRLVSRVEHVTLLSNQERPHNIPERP